MSKSKVLASLAVLIVAAMLGGCGKQDEALPQAQLPGQSEQSPTQEDKQEPASEDTEPGTLMSLSELMARGKPMECTWNENESNGGSVTGHMVINGKQFKNDVTVESLPGEEGGEALQIETHSISDGTWVYIWNSMQPGKGTKMDLAKLEQPATATDTPEKQDLDLDRKLDYKCTDWSSDAAIFTPPSEIIFEDVTAETNKLMKDATDPANAQKMNKLVCDLCKQAPDESSRAECLKNAGCE